MVRRPRLACSPGGPGTRFPACDRGRPVLIHAGKGFTVPVNSGKVQAMTDVTPSPAETQRATSLDTAMREFLSRNYQGEHRVMIAAAMLVAMVPQSVLSRPDPRPTTLVPRWCVALLRAEIDELSPGMIDELKEIARKAGMKV